MKPNQEKSRAIVEEYNKMNSEYGLTPNDYMVWRALINACTKKDLETQRSKSVPISDIGRELKINIKDIQKIISRLEKKGLAKKIGEGWVYVLQNSKTEEQKPSNGAALD